MKKAQWWKPLKEGKVQCELCCHYCVISPGSRGRCNVRRNDDSVLYSLNFGNVVASNVDPVEKKPLYHFFPGSQAFSVAAMGCNFSCMFCQNCTISQAHTDSSYGVTSFMTPAEVVDRALKTGCKSIAHTYTEPTVYYEYVYETAVIAREKGLKTILVSNGFLSPQAAEKLIPFVDGINIDLKAWSDETYKSLIGGRVQPVLDNIELFHKRGVLVEVTTLVVPQMNSTSEELKEIAQWIASVDRRIPWHVSRFYPAYKMADRSPTSLEKIEEAWQIGIDAGLAYVYTGNVPRGAHESTLCYNCGKLLVERKGYALVENNVIEMSNDEGARVAVCPDCKLVQNFAVDSV